MQGTTNLLFIVAIFAVMYFFMIRPQQKKQKELQKFRNNLKIGDEVVTSGGIYGKVKRFNETDNSLMVEIASGVAVKVDRNCVFASAPLQA